MKKLLIITIVLLSCDPVHDLTLENQSQKELELFFYPELCEQFTQGKIIKKVDYKNVKMSYLKLKTSENIKIGTVIASYKPTTNDIDLEFLEIRYDKDTLRLSGKNAILSTIQKIKKFDWRLVIK